MNFLNKFMKIALFLALNLLITACAALGGDKAIKDQDKLSPCAGCDDRVYPKDNNKYLV